MTHYGHRDKLTRTVEQSVDINVLYNGRSVPISSLPADREYLLIHPKRKGAIAVTKGRSVKDAFIEFHQRDPSLWDYAKYVFSVQDGQGGKK